MNRAGSGRGRKARSTKTRYYTKKRRVVSKFKTMFGAGRSTGSTDV